MPRSSVFPPKPRPTDQIPSTGLRRAHRSHDLLTSLFAPASIPPTETTAYRPLPAPFHHDVASAYKHVLSTLYTALTETSANLDRADHAETVEHRGIRVVVAGESIEIHCDFTRRFVFCRRRQV